MILIKKNPATNISFNLNLCKSHHCFFVQCQNFIIHIAFFLNTYIVFFFSQIVANSNVAQPLNTVNFSLKTPDDQWIYCETRGCSFWTRKPERMIRHRQCHRPDTKYYKCPDCSLRLVHYSFYFLG